MEQKQTLSTSRKNFYCSLNMSKTVYHHFLSLSTKFIIKEQVIASFMYLQDKLELYEKEMHLTEELYKSNQSMSISVGCLDC